MHSGNQHIYLASQKDYAGKTLAANMQALLGPVTQTTNLRDARVLLKPNLLTATNSGLSCTDARFIMAAAQCFLDQGAKLQLGDSPSFGSAASVLASMDVLKPLQAMGVRVVEFKQNRKIQSVTTGKAGGLTDCEPLKAVYSTDSLTTFRWSTT